MAKRTGGGKRGEDRPERGKYEQRGPSCNLDEHGDPIPVRYVRVGPLPPRSPTDARRILAAEVARLGHCIDELGRLLREHAARLDPGEVAAAGAYIDVIDAAAALLDEEIDADGDEPPSSDPGREA